MFGLNKAQEAKRQEALKIIDLFLVLMEDTRDFTPEEYLYVAKYFERNNLEWAGIPESALEMHIDIALMEEYGKQFADGNGDEEAFKEFEKLRAKMRNGQ